MKLKLFMSILSLIETLIACAALFYAAKAFNAGDYAKSACLLIFCVCHEIGRVANVLKEKL